MPAPRGTASCMHLTSDSETCAFNTEVHSPRFKYPRKDPTRNPKPCRYATGGEDRAPGWAGWRPEIGDVGVVVHVWGFGGDGGAGASAWGSEKTIVLLQAAPLYVKPAPFCA